MENVRTEPLRIDEISRFHEDGYLFPIRALTQDQASELGAAVDDHLSGRMVSPKYELTDPIRINRIKDATGKTTFEYADDGQAEPHTFGFLFNLWKRDDRFQKIAFNASIAGMARQLLNCDEVVLMEDNVVIKSPHTRTLPWHQDYSYWPLATPAAVTVWIALDRITSANGAMQLVPGSHRRGEKLPVAFGDASSFMRDDRPGVNDISQDPAAEGDYTVTYDLYPGECGFHHAMVWHSSTPNRSSTSRKAFVLRYVASGTRWLGNERFPYDEVGLAIGDPIGGPHFPIVPTAF